MSVKTPSAVMYKNTKYTVVLKVCVPLSHSGGPALLMERMEHTHYGRHFVDEDLDDSLLFFPQRSLTSTKNRTVGSSLDK
jgi:hypothetical protein